MPSIFSAIRIWADMVKLSHSIFALPFALMATFLAGRNLDGRGYPYWGQLGLILICMVSARSVAMTFNRIVDAQIDSRNPRTASRPIPAGRLSFVAAWGMLFVFVVTFGIGCLGFHLYYQNTWPILFSGPVLIYLCGYSFAKRFTKWSHFYLGSAIAISPVAAWLAIHPQTLGFEALILMGVVTLWISGFDIIYSCQDIEIDKQEGLFSLPSRVGPVVALWIARFSHFLVVVGLISLYFVADMGMIYLAGVALAAILLTVENSLVHPGDYSRVNIAFFTLNGIVSIVLAIAVITDVLVAIPL